MESFMRQRAIFLDLDGTIAAGNRPPSEADTAAIRRARAAGHRVFLCTGRAPSYIYDSVLEVGFDGIVGAAGGYIRLGGEVVYRRPLSAGQLRRAIEIYQACGKRVYLEGEENMYTLHAPPSERRWPPVDGPAASLTGHRWRSPANRPARHSPTPISAAAHSPAAAQQTARVCTRRFARRAVSSSLRRSTSFATSS